MQYILQLGIVIFAVAILLTITMTVVTLIGALLYDYQKLRQKQTRSSKLYQPRVTVVIPAHNEEQVIERCLNSLLESTYRNFEILVADDASTDNTREVVQRFIKRHKTRPMGIWTRRKNGGRGATINSAIIPYARGELVMAIDADCIVHPDAIGNAVRHFADRTVAAVAANVRIMEQPRLLSLVQLFEYLVGFRAKKFYSLADCEYIVGGAGAMYRRDIFRGSIAGFDETMQTEDIALSLRIAMLGNRRHRLVYGSDVLLYTEPVPTFRSLLRQRYRWKFGGLQAIYKHKRLLFRKGYHHRKLLGWFRLPLALWSEVLLLLEPFFFSYFLVVAITGRNPTLFIQAWIVLTILLCLTVVSDEYLSTKTKVKLLLLTPCMYLLFYIMTLVQVLAALRCVRHLAGILGKQRVRGAWVSPERIG